MVKQHYYLEVPKCLREQVHLKHPEVWWNQNLFNHHDNAPAHTALSVQQFLTTKNMAMVPYPPYLPGLAPSDLFLFLRIKLQVKGCCFQNVSEIQEQLLTILHAISKCQFQQWQKHWTHYINSEGDNDNKGKHIFHYSLSSGIFDMTSYVLTHPQTRTLYNTIQYLTQWTDTFVCTPTSTIVTSLATLH
jgi:hypothetical protein